MNETPSYRERHIGPYYPEIYSDEHHRPESADARGAVTDVSTPSPVIPALLGPTASGKSALALRLAERLGMEIVSVDSALVYVGMDIGTAKPSREERARVRHHLIDLVPPTQAYSAARFALDARHALREILARGGRPLLVGGTLLYYRALAEGLSELPQASAELRLAIDREAAERGWPALHAELARIDARSAARIEPEDRQRIQRALEVYRLTGEPLSKLQGRRARDAEFRFQGILLLPEDRAQLHERIATRLEAMFAAGLVDELRALRARYALDAELPAMRAVGYRQSWEFLEGQCSEREMRERALYATRQLAKRQITWLRAMAGMRLDPFCATVESQLEQALSTHEAQDSAAQQSGRNV